MRIYKISQNDIKRIKWACPNTGTNIVADFQGDTISNSDIINGYALYFGDGSYCDTYETWEEASREAKKADQRCNISKMGTATRIERYENI